MRRIALAICLLAFPLASAASGGALAQTAPLSCGDTITVDTTLDRDLLDCPNNGIVIGADDITLDLNGHTISGDGKPFKACPEREICDVGVLNDGHDGVTVRNGSVGQFDERRTRRQGTREPRAGHLLVSKHLLRLRGLQVGANPGPRQLGKPQHRSRGRWDGVVRVA